MISVYHKGKHHLAFYTTKVLAPGEHLKASLVRDINEQPVQVGAPMQCGTCGSFLSVQDLTYLKVTES